NVRKTGILGIDATTNQAVCAIFNDKSVLDSGYLFFYLRSQRDNLMKKAFGGAQPNISQDVINKLEIPLPPTKEQKRIVTKIEDLFKESRTSRQALDMITHILKNFRQYVLATAFTGKLVPHYTDDEYTDKF